VADIDTVVKSGAAATELEGAGLSWREYYQKADNIIPYALIQPGDEQWVIRARAQKEDTHGLVQSAFSPQLLVVGMAVLIVLLSLSYAVAMSLRTAKLLERKVEAKTEDLRDYHEKLRVALDDLEVAHTFLQSIIDGVGEPIMVVGSDYRVKLMNLAAREFAHGDTNPSEPLFCYQVSHHNEAPCMGTQHPCPMERVRESGQPVTVLHEHYQANGEPRFVEVIASPLWGADGSFQGIIEAVRDLTERLTTEGMLTEQIEELAPDELERFSTKVIGSIQDLFAELPPG
jgi:PAS domain-containing protein